MEKLLKTNRLGGVRLAFSKPCIHLKKGCEINFAYICTNTKMAIPFHRVYDRMDSFNFDIVSLPTGTAYMVCIYISRIVAFLRFCVFC